ncbi:uncharacterized protein TNCT_30121 [Trichonephila clavata]|uniref:Uncharacterized protein n=1 Tax=Trichonephila clavata TaxID=2740835 RepID=A0A8X6FMP9_TRICU|nr:uncharacterized protein TNCT_30121 [Trichonephila clavata]
MSSLHVRFNATKLPQVISELPQTYMRQKAKSKYRDRIRLKRASQEGTNKTPYDRAKQLRERKRMNAAEWINDGASTSAAGAVEIM